LVARRHSSKLPCNCISLTFFNNNNNNNNQTIPTQKAEKPITPLNAIPGILYYESFGGHLQKSATAGRFGSLSFIFLASNEVLNFLLILKKLWQTA